MDYFPYICNIRTANIIKNCNIGTTKTCERMKNVIIEQNISNLTNAEMKSYRAFAYCYKGFCDIDYNGKKITLKSNQCAIFLNLSFVNNTKPSPDFVCDTIYIDESFLRQHGPRHPYIIQASLALYADPIINVGEDDQELCINLFVNFQRRVEITTHKFYDGILRTSAQMLALDLFDIYSRTHISEKVTQKSSDIMARFIQMLQAKEYRYNREVAYYAEQLCVVPKYLSEICNKVSGFSASYWINKFTAQDIYELLTRDGLPSSEIAEMFHFTSTSYFNRYTKRYLGAYPSELRNK